MEDLYPEWYYSTFHFSTGIIFLLIGLFSFLVYETILPSIIISILSGGLMLLLAYLNNRFIKYQFENANELYILSLVSRWLIILFCLIVSISDENLLLLSFTLVIPLIGFVKRIYTQTYQWDKYKIEKIKEKIVQGYLLETISDFNIILDKGSLPQRVKGEISQIRDNCFKNLLDKYPDFNQLDVNSIKNKSAYKTEYAVIWIIFILWQIISLLPIVVFTPELRIDIFLILYLPFTILITYFIIKFYLKIQKEKSDRVKLQLVIDKYSGLIEESDSTMHIISDKGESSLLPIKKQQPRSKSNIIAIIILMIIWIICFPLIMMIGITDQAFALILFTILCIFSLVILADIAREGTKKEEELLGEKE